MTRPKQSQIGREEAGFILPAVIMFVAVLTILGLSLFSLSSYEGQFMNASLDRSQAFYLASGAIDRARFLLTIPPYNLATVAGNLGPGITYAEAIQGGNNSGPVQWNGDPVEIRVEAEKNGQRRRLEARFNPDWSAPYDNLFSMSSVNRGLKISKTSGSGDPNGHTYLYGTVWQTYQGTDPPPGYHWYDDIYPTGDPTSFDVIKSPVPLPQVPAFVSGNWAGAAAPAWTGLGGQNICNLDATAGGDPDRVRFFKTPKVSGDWSLDIQSGQPVDVNVNGIAIWLLDSGLRSTRTVRVNGASNDLLVICAKKTRDSQGLLIYGVENVGMVFVGGFHSPTVPVILVSDGYVAMDNDALPTVSTLDCTLGWTAIYSDFAWIEGPDLPNTGTYIFRHAAGANPQAEANLQKLLDRGLLPNASSQRRKLAYIPGSWQETAPN